MDPALNGFVAGSESICCAFGEELETLRKLPVLESASQYYQLVLDAADEPIESLKIQAVLLGYDLTEARVSVGTSSLLNCGAWSGLLAPLSDRRNRFGLLDMPDAQLAVTLLPQVWGKEEHHALVGVRVVFELDRTLR